MRDACRSIPLRPQSTESSAKELFIVVNFTREVFTSTPLCVIRHRFMCRCYHKAVNEKTDTSVKVYFLFTDVTDEQFETITNLELEKYHCIVINLSVITSRTCLKVNYCLEGVFNPLINRHFRR